MEADVVDLIEEGGRIVGVRAQTPDGPLEVRADLVVGADGRHSIVREQAGLEVSNIGAPIDVLWMRLSKQAERPGRRAVGRINYGRMLVTLDRGDYWQCAYRHPQGRVRRDARPRPRRRSATDIVQARAVPRATASANCRTGIEVKLLTVAVDRLKRWWRPGLLCIGDAAHAMSPIGGVGINLAIQDAVAAANILAAPLRAGTLTTGDLDAGATPPHAADAGDPGRCR